MSSVVSYFKTLVPIANPSGREETLRNFIESEIRRLGFTDTRVDEAGNLFVRIPGQPDKEPLLLSAHMDSVPPCEGIEPVMDTQADGRNIIRSAGKTILGADDKSGVACILALLSRIREAGSLDNHPLELFCSTGEEVGLLGAKAFDITQCKSRSGLVLDGEGCLGELFLAGPTQYNLLFELEGKASHAGISPETGVSAIAMAARLCAGLPNGRLSADTTMNIGTIEGGAAMNIVAPRAVVRSEARSHDNAALNTLLEEIHAVCRSVEAAFPGGSIRFTPTHRYSAFEVPASHPVVQRFEDACERLNLVPQLNRMNIGSDAHVLNHNGLPTVVVGMGFHYSHSLGEFIVVEELERVTDLVWEMIR